MEIKYNNLEMFQGKPDKVVRRVSSTEGANQRYYQLVFFSFFHVPSFRLSSKSVVICEFVFLQTLRNDGYNKLSYRNRNVHRSAL